MISNLDNADCILLEVLLISAILAFFRLKLVGCHFRVSRSPSVHAHVGSPSACLEGRSLRLAAAVHGCVWEPQRVRVRARCSHSHATLSEITTCRDRQFRSASEPTVRWGRKVLFHPLFPTRDTGSCPGKLLLTTHPRLASRSGREAANQHGCCAL